MSDIDLDRYDRAALTAALRAVLDVLDRRGQEVADSLPSGIVANLVVSTGQFQISARDIRDAITKALA